MSFARRAIKPVKPGPGQESVWDYPRPPRIEKTSKRIQIQHAGIMIADSTNAFRCLETSHPPTYYIPPSDIKMQYFNKNQHRTFCEFKGEAEYYDMEIPSSGDSGKAVQIGNIAWSYPSPTNGYEPLKDHLAVYPSKVDSCFVNNERVQCQAGDFYGGWITNDIVGPFKGGEGTWGW